MKLRSKDATARISVRHATSGETEPIVLEEYLTTRQISKMASRPDMLLQFCHHIAKKYTGLWGERPQIDVDVQCSLNARPYQPLVNPGVDLGQEQRNLWPTTWIASLRQAGGDVAPDVAGASGQN
jgi:hypothetical protein